MLIQINKQGEENVLPYSRMSRKLTFGNHHSSKFSQETTDTKSRGQKFDDKNLVCPQNIY